MKKQLFVLGLAVAALASCTNEEVTDIAESNVIGFNAPFVGNVTKVATEMSKDNLASFYVYAYKGSDALLTNENVYLQNGLWAYDNIKQYESATYAFAAYSNTGTQKGQGGLDDGNVTFTTSPSKSLAISDYTASGDDDLLVSISPDDLSAANKKVDFTFNHALSMIKFTIKSGLGNGQKLSITEFEVEADKIQNKGDMTYTDAGAAWTLDSPASYAGLNVVDAMEATTETPAESAIFTVIPQTVSGGFNISFTATIVTTDGTAQTIEKNFTASVPETAWEDGMRYNYITTITGINMDVIEFNQPEVTAWDDADDTDTTLQPASN